MCINLLCFLLITALPKKTDSMECDGRKLNRFVLFVNHVLPVLGALLTYCNRLFYEIF